MYVINGKHHYQNFTSSKVNLVWYCISKDCSEGTGLCCSLNSEAYHVVVCRDKANYYWKFFSTDRCLIVLEESLENFKWLVLILLNPASMELYTNLESTGFNFISFQNKKFFAFCSLQSKNLTHFHESKIHKNTEVFMKHWCQNENAWV